MRGWRSWVTGLTMVLLASIWVARPVEAASCTSGSGVFVFNGCSVTVDGLKFTVENATLELNGTVQSSYGSTGTYTTGDGFAGATLTATAFRGANLTINGGMGGSADDIFLSSSGETGTYDLSYTLEITRASGSPIVTPYWSTLSGTSSTHITSADELYKCPSTSVCSSGGTAVSGSSQALNMSTTPFVDTTLSPSLSITSTQSYYDTSTLVMAGGSLTLSSFKQYYGPAPEPISISVFGVGLAGLGLVRRLRAKRRRPV